MENRIINCKECGEEVILRITQRRAKRCRPCQDKENYRNQKEYRNSPERKAFLAQRGREQREEKRRLLGKPPIGFTKKLIAKITKEEYLHNNKPKMIAFLASYKDNLLEDIDLLWCDNFIEFISEFYPPGLAQRECLMDAVNHYISEIIKEYSK